MVRRARVMPKVRTVHRWVSLAFVVAAVSSLTSSLVRMPQELVDISAVVAISLLLVLMASGVWIAVSHYSARARRVRRRTTPLGATVDA